MRIRAATPADAAALAAIYAPYVNDSHISFETDAPDAGTMRGRIEAGDGLHPWLVAVGEDGEPLGYAHAAPFRSRAAYRFAVETSVYVRRGAHGRGVGRELYVPLLATLEAQGFTQAIAAIALPNPASVRLHERLGFVHAGTYAQVGFKRGGWWDVGLWQRPLAAAGVPPAEPRRLGEVERQTLE